MRLDGKGLVAIKQGGVFTKRGRGDNLRLCGARDHLILMPRIQGHILTVQLVCLRPDGPAAVELFDLAAKRLGDDLVAKTHADHGSGCRVNLADQILQRSDPGQILISAELGAGDQPSICGLGPVREGPIDHRIGVKFQPLTLKKAGKNFGVVAVVGNQRVGHVAGLQNADFHGSPEGCWIRVKRHSNRVEIDFGLLFGRQIGHLARLLPLGQQHVADQFRIKDAGDVRAVFKRLNRRVPRARHLRQVQRVGVSSNWGRGIDPVFDAVQRGPQNCCDGQIRVHVTARQSMLDPAGRRRA
mmetsp:Transcript_22566/g.36779  ORF Transcript_22566/g.36779 Transcript_22566/m.36779 type:complete len:299 (+) Transcript_22566:1574-2470(+)